MSRVYNIWVSNYACNHSITGRVLFSKNVVFRLIDISICNGNIFDRSANIHHQSEAVKAEISKMICVCNTNYNY